MCITTGPARLSNTRIYSAEVLRPDGTLCHVLGYQNSVVTSPGPNAMLLPFPAAAKVTPANLVNAAGFPDILKEYEEEVRAQHRPRGGGAVVVEGAAATDAFTLFESGSYTVVLAESAKALKPALDLVPPERRPEISTHLLFSLARYYPRWPIALCCFEGVEQSAAYEQGFGPEPLFWWYEPRRPDVLFAPGLDAHDGAPPDAATTVARDHVVAFGSHLSPARPSPRLRRAIDETVPPEHRWMFVDRVHGEIFERPTRNGDFFSSAVRARGERFSAFLETTLEAPPFSP